MARPSVAAPAIPRLPGHTETFEWKGMLQMGVTRVLTSSLDMLRRSISQHTHSVFSATAAWHTFETPETLPYKTEHTCCLYSLRGRPRWAVVAETPSAPPRTAGRLPNSIPMATDNDHRRWRPPLHDVLRFCRNMAAGEPFSVSESLAVALWLGCERERETHSLVHELEQFCIAVNKG